MNVEYRDIAAGSALRLIDPHGPIDRGLATWPQRDTLSGRTDGSLGKSRSDSCASGPRQTDMKFSAASDDGWRRPARWRDCFFAWRQGDSFQGLAGQLISIGPRSALLLAAHAPEPAVMVQFCLEGLDQSGWIHALVVGCEPSFHRTRIHLDFQPLPCPPEVLLAALEGSEPDPPQSDHTRSHRLSTL